MALTNCVFDDNALRPGTCPLPKHAVLFNTILNTGYQALFCLFVISAKQKRKLKSIHILVKNLDKVLASREWIWLVSANLMAGLLPHFSAFPGLPFARRATCFKTCFVNTPRQRNLTPF